MAELDKFFGALHKHGGSDLHLSSGSPPNLRLHGSMVALKVPPLPPEQVMALLDEVIPERFKQQFQETGDADFAYEVPGIARFRCNVFRDRRGPGGVFRIIPNNFLTAQQLNLPESILNFCTLNKGLVLVTGPTGSGKSTTLTAMVDYINDQRKDHIITIEDPIEFVHENKKCLVNQREVHDHTQSFSRALRAALREDPDIVLVGEMRDLETTHIAIETAETGHLVFGTLHTTTAASTVDRIIDQFPADRQEQIRAMLANSLKGVISQTLCKRKGGKGRIAALEVMVVNSAIANNIREAKTYQIPSIMQTGAKEGMTLLNDALIRLVINGDIEPEEALNKSIDRKDMKQKLTVAGFDQSGADQQEEA
jgi:twitching motility protein PilT